MPRLGETKQFPNGKWGKFDGLGWEPTQSPQPTDVHVSMQGEPSAPPPPSSSTTEDVVTTVGLPTIGGLIGGKTPLGPVGSAIGAATGQAYGDLWNMLHSAAGHEGYGAIPTPGEEATKLMATGGLTYLGERVVPKVLQGVGALKQMLPSGSATLGGSGLGWLLGHTGAGAAVGAAIDAAPQVAKGVEWLGKPAAADAEASGVAAMQKFLQDTPANSRTGSGIQKMAKQAGETARREGMAKLSPIGRALSDTSGVETWPGNIKSAANYVGEKASDAMGGLKSMWKQWKNPVTTSSPLESPADVAETLFRNKTANPSVRPDLSNTPSRSHAAEVDLTGNWHAPAEEPFGANTVGAAQSKGANIASGSKTYLPQSVDEAKGLSLPEQAKWEAYKASTPGATDAHLNDWYRTNRLGGNPHEGMPVTGLIDSLLATLKK